MKTLSLWVQDVTPDRLREIAGRLGVLAEGAPVPGRPNLSALLDRIASGEFEVVAKKEGKE